MEAAVLTESTGVSSATGVHECGTGEPGRDGNGNYVGLHELFFAAARAAHRESKNHVLAFAGKGLRGMMEAFRMRTTAPVEGLMTYRQVSRVGNAQFRDAWVLGALTQCRNSADSPSLLDVGAGASPYRQVAESLGYKYRSHDFAAYVPDAASPGLQDASWVYPSHDFICDITAIPASGLSDVVLCTEVLEHVPDPVRAFEHMVGLVRPGGHLILTVPFLSLMHQSPFWFQAGLSPFWFEHWSDKLQVDVVELLVQGDYADLMAQELTRLFTFRPRIRGLGRLGAICAQGLRGRLPVSVLESGGLGTLYIGTKR